MNLHFAATPGAPAPAGLTADPFLLSLIGIRTKATPGFSATATQAAEGRDFNPLLASAGKLMGRT